MKRKRPDRHDQSLTEQENPSSTKSFRSNITGNLKTLLNGFVSELQSISEDKRQDVALLFSPKYKETNCTDVSSTVKSAFPSLANSSDSTKVLQNFINSAKSRISGLLNNKPESQVSGGINLLKNLRSSTHPKTKSLSIDPLEIQINLKFQSLLFKAFDTKKASHVNEKQDVATTESIITEKDWQDLSRMLQDFSQSAKKKLHASLTKERNSQFLNGSVSNQNSIVKESQSSHNSQPSLDSQAKSQNKELQKPSINQGNSSSNSLASEFSKLTKKNTKLLKMDFFSESTDSSSSPRNPFDEGCMLLLSDAEKCPKYVELHLSSDSDIDEPEDVGEPPNSSLHQSESEDEVIVLGEKSKTYQEVTLEEDDDGQVHESVVEKVVEKGPTKEREVEELLFNCPKCDKSFRVQSLLQFHIKMHTMESPPSNASKNQCSNSSSSSEDENSAVRPRNLNQRRLNNCLSQDALVSQKDLGLNGEFSILNAKALKVGDKCVKKVKEASKFSISCETSASKDSTIKQQVLSSNDEKRFMFNNQIDYSPDLSALSGRGSSESYKSSGSLKLKHSFSDEKNFRKSRASKPSSNHENFALEDTEVSRKVWSSFDERRFFQIGLCSDLQHSFANKKIIRKGSKPSKSSDFENFSSEDATLPVLDSTVNCGFLSTEEIDRCPDYPDLSMIYGRENSEPEMSSNALKHKDSFTDEESFKIYEKASKSSVKFENIASEDVAISHKVLTSIIEKRLPNEQCLDHPDLSMVYNQESLSYKKNPNTLKEKHSLENKRRFEKCKVSKSIYNGKNFASEDENQKVPNLKSEVGFLEGPIERCPENPDLSMIFDWESLGSEKNPNTLKEKHSYENERRFGKGKASKSVYKDKNFTAEDADQKVQNLESEVGFMEGRIERCPENPDLSMMFDWQSSDFNNNL